MPGSPPHWREDDEEDYDRYVDAATAASAAAKGDETADSSDGSEPIMEETLHHKLSDLLHILSAMEGQGYPATDTDTYSDIPPFDYGAGEFSDTHEESQASKRFDQETFFLK